MFRSLTILRELLQNLAKVIFLFKHSVKLRRCILCGDVAPCRVRTPFHDMVPHLLITRSGQYTRNVFAL